MAGQDRAGARCVALVGPYTSGKTTLLEAMLHTAGATARKGSVPQGNTVGDASAEARDHQMSVEPNFAHCEYLGEAWSLIDCPGSVELMYDTYTALLGADVAVVVVPPEIERALTLAPFLKLLDEYDIPHMLFVNRMDKANVRVRDLMAALQGASSKPLVLRQVPIRDGDQVTGFVDLVSERAWKYNENKQSDLIEMPSAVVEREEEARQELLESLADFDDALLEQLLEDKVPPAEEIYAQLSKDLASDLIVPVFFGSAELGHGITRLMKALRHETPGPKSEAERLGIPQDREFAATVIRTVHQAHTGKLSIARLWYGAIKEGTTIGGERPSGLYHLMGAETRKIEQAEAGHLIALGRLDEVRSGDLLTDKGVEHDALPNWPQPPQAVYAFAIRPVNRQDDVRLTSSLAKLIEEDASLGTEQNPSTRELLFLGQGEIHLKLALERLKSKYKVDVASTKPQTAYKETIRKGTKQHARFKKQTGGHGQFGDVHVEIKPLPRGQGFEFIDKIVGGAIPRQFIPAVEAGAREFLERGPLGFPVVDVSVTLYDGQHHSVDSSEQAFKTAGRMALSEALPKCQPVLLECIYNVAISVPNEYTNKIHSLVSTRRGQILGFEMKAGWEGWDELKCQLPESEIQDLIIELRSLTMGTGSFECAFDHLQEISGKQADQIIAHRQEELARH